MTKDKSNKSLNEGDVDESLTVQEGKQTFTYEERLNFVNEIACPMASRKLTKKIYKLIKKAHKEGKAYWSGLKNVQAKLRKGGHDGIVILAGDVNPIDVYSHLPAVCEDKDIPYAFVPSREDIGLAMGVNRAVITAFIAESDSYKDLYDEVRSEIKLLPIPV